MHPNNDTPRMSGPPGPPSGVTTLHDATRRSRWRAAGVISAALMVVALVGTVAALNDRPPPLLGVSTDELGSSGKAREVDEVGPDDSGAIAASSTTTTALTATTTTTAPPPAKAAFLYATRSGTHVNVFRATFDGSGPEALFAYDDTWRDHGDHATPAPPDLALAPDRRRVAYVAQSGLRVRDLETGTDQVIIGRTEEAVGSDGGVRVRWSIPEMNPPADDPDGTSGGVFRIFRPQWSPDGRFLAFGRSGYEYQGHGIVEVATGRYLSDRGSEDLAWSPTEPRAAVTGTWYAYEGELWVSAAGPGNFEDIRPRIPGSKGHSYVDSIFLSSGQELAVTYADEEFGPPIHLALVGIDGRNFREVDGAGVKQAMASTPDGASLYYTERRGDRVVLVHRDLTTDRTTDLRVLPAEFHAWPDLRVTDSGHLTVVGRTRVPWEREQPQCDDACPEHRTQLFVLNAATGETLHHTPVLNRFTAFAGLLIDPPATTPADLSDQRTADGPGAP